MPLRLESPVLGSSCPEPVSTVGPATLPWANGGDGRSLFQLLGSDSGIDVVAWDRTVSLLGAWQA